MFTPRITWPDLPEGLQRRIESALGSAVVTHVGQSGGFSPGVADRLVLADGRRVFCKAVSEQLNADSHQLYQRELSVNGLLPPGVPSPRLQHGFAHAGDGDWIVLLFDDIEGRHPARPWQAEQVDAALASLDRLARVGTPCPEGVPDAAKLLGWDLTQCWALVAEAPPASLDPWIGAHLDELAAAGARAAGALASGDTLCQLDARADNMLIDSAETVWLVDWPWGCRGPAWLDTAFFGMFACPDTDGVELNAVINAHASRHGGTPDQVTDVWAGELGYYVHMAEQPPPPNLPTIRAFQARMRDALTAAVRDRLDAG